MSDKEMNMAILNKWRHSGMMDYSYYMLDTDNNKVLDY